VENSLVTVLMPVYNAEKYLKEAIDSILNQTYTNIEFLIINDGSTDGSEDIIYSYKDSRIRFVKNPQNMGLIATLNKGLDLANGKYIARMDADDVSMPTRLKTQVNYMEANSDVAVCGSKIITMDDDGNELKHAPYMVTDPDRMKHFLTVDDCIVHPSVMMRTNMVQNKFYYDPKYLHSEDYDFFLRISERHKVANLEEKLLKYRLSVGGVSRKHVDEQLRNTAEISRLALRRRGIEFNRQEYISPALSKEQLLQAKADIQALFNKQKLTDDQKWALRYLWYVTCSRGTQHGLWMAKQFYGIKGLVEQKVDGQMQIRLLVKCLLKRKLAR